MGVIRGLTRPLPVPGPLGVPGPYQIFPGTRLKTKIFKPMRMWSRKTKIAAGREGGDGNFNRNNWSRKTKKSATLLSNRPTTMFNAYGDTPPPCRAH